jgi:hypothetical protein
MIKSPVQFDADDYLLTGTILGLTATSTSLDDHFRSGALKIKSKTNDRMSNFTEKFGDTRYGILLSGALYGSGLIFEDSYTRQTGQMLAEAILFSGLITTGAKMLFNRARPFTNEGRYDLDLFEFESDFDETSLPSGHTSTAFTMATILSNRINNSYASIALYSLAGMTALQRIYVDKHWFSDTILGAAIGTVVGLKIISLHDNDAKEEGGLTYSIFPKVNSGNYGLGFTLNF